MPQFCDYDEKTRRKLYHNLTRYQAPLCFAGAKISLVEADHVTSSVEASDWSLDVVEPHFAGAHHEVTIIENGLDDHISRQHLGRHHLRK